VASRFTLVDSQVAQKLGVLNQELVTVTRQLSKKKNELEEALAKVKTLEGLLPICSFCKKIRNNTGCWEEVEKYVHVRSNADFTHSLCPECLKKHYPDFCNDDNKSA
jgi:hypothetical protein